MLLGIERLREQQFRQLDGKRIALLTNPSAIDQEFNTTFNILYSSDSIEISALFAPEHGLQASVPDATSVQDTVDEETGIPVYSLYGSHSRPSANMLENIDAVVCDIQDLGVRYYTYVSTVTHIIEACGEWGVEVVILDRPNPLGGRVDGSALDPDYASFVGRFNIPQQHGMTLGEVASLFNGEWNPTPAKLTVIQCYGWKRWQQWSDTNLHFITTSPAIPNSETVYHYPGTCLLEGTNISEGRGTALPFQIAGAPYVNGRQLTTALNNLNMDGVCFRPHTFRPTDSKYAGEYCHGVQAHITDHRTYRPLRVWMAVILEVRSLHREEFAWLSPDQTLYERGSHYHFDYLMGSDRTRQMIDDDFSLDEIVANWHEGLEDFRKRRKPYLLYD